MTVMGQAPGVLVHHNARGVPPACGASCRSCSTLNTTSIFSNERLGTIALTSVAVCWISRAPVTARLTLKRYKMETTKSSAPPTVFATPPTSPTSSRQYQMPLTPQRRATEIPHSPSTPHLALEPAAPDEPSIGGLTSVGKGLARSRTLPHRSISIGRANKGIPGLDGVRLEASKLTSLRKWILGLAIGALL